MWIRNAEEKCLFGERDEMGSFLDTFVLRAYVGGDGDWD